MKYIHELLPALVAIKDFVTSTPTLAFWLVLAIMVALWVSLWESDPYSEYK